MSSVYFPVSRLRPRGMLNQQTVLPKMGRKKNKNNRPSKGKSKQQASSVTSGEKSSDSSKDLGQVSRSTKGSGGASQTILVPVRCISSWNPVLVQLVSTIYPRYVVDTLAAVEQTCLESRSIKNCPFIYRGVPMQD